jgi:glutathione S-transferase
VPVLVDHASGLTLPESDTILRFIVDKYAECVV